MSCRFLHACPNGEIEESTSVTAQNINLAGSALDFIQPRGGHLLRTGPLINTTYAPFVKGSKQENRILTNDGFLMSIR